MDNPSQHIQDLIIKLFCGEIDEASLQELRAWASASPDHERYLQEEQEIWFSSVTKEELSRFDSRAAYDLFKRRVAEAREEESIATDVDGSSHEMGLYFPRWARYAAAIVLLIATIGFAFKQGQNTMTSQLTDITIEAPKGSQTRTTLPDGTVVWLNAGSRLTYPQAYGLKDRRVTLTGEARFDVHHNSRQPFSVTTQSLCVNDIGTRFNLRDYPGDDEAEVLLEEGAVSLDNLIAKSEPAAMSPGQRAVIDKHTGKLRIGRSDPAAAIQWTTGKLVLNGETLAGIAQKIERFYGARVVVDAKSQNTGRFFGEFSRRDDSLSDVLKALSSTRKLKYRIHGDTIILY